MLASPLRQCVITHAILPKALMVQICRFVPASEPKWPEIASTGLESRLNKIVQDIIQDQKAPRPLRWIRRRARQSLLSSLKEEAEVLKHKFRTSQTGESRDRFFHQLQVVSDKIRVLTSRNRRGEILPVGMMKDHVVLRKYEGDGNKTLLVPRGQSVWCTLHHGVIPKLADKGVEKSLYSTLKTTSNLAEIISYHLAQRVLHELRLLKNRIDSWQTDEAANKGWIVRRMRGEEVRNFVFRPSFSPITIRDSSAVRIATILRFPPAGHAYPKDHHDDPKEESTSLPPIHDIAQYFSPEELDEVQSLLRVMSQTFHKKAMRGKRLQLKALQKQSISNDGQLPFLSGTQIESENQCYWDQIQTDKALSTNVTRMKSSTSDSLTDLNTKVWPRLYVIKEDKATVDLCIALWRLHLYNTAG